MRDTMQKKLTLLAAALLLCAGLIGCRTAAPERNNLDSRMFYANIKADAFSQHGKKAACYDGRVYYLGAELGTQGVYSMSSDGTNIRFEFPVEDMRALWVGDEGYLYSGYQGIGENYNGSYRCFCLYQKIDAAANAVDLLASVWETEADPAQELPMQEQMTNAWDFYRSDDGTVFARCIGLQWSGTPVFFNVTLQDGIVPPGDSVPFAYEKFDFGKYWPGKLSFTTSGNIVLQYGIDASYSLFDRAKAENALVLGPDRIFDAENNSVYNCYDSWLCALDDATALLAGQNGVLRCDLKTGRSQLLARFPNSMLLAKESIYHIRLNHGDLLLLTEKRCGNLLPLPNNMRHVLSESLYRLDSETGERERLLKLGYGQSFVFVDEAYAAFAKGNTVHVYDITGKTATKISDCTLLHPIVTDENKVEVAGDWLFLYGFNENTGRDELLEKIRFRNAP